jgi:hypothetical protein
VCRLPLPICVLFDCYNGAAFPSGELHSSLGFLSGLTELVGVRGSIMLQRRNYDQSFVMFLLFANVAQSLSSHYVVIVMVMIVLYFLLVLFTVIKYFVTLEISVFS